jgi:outer membrane scaffolding protein for murein synthesis (MipA/OmpV family)
MNKKSILLALMAIAIGITSRAEAEEFGAGIVGLSTPHYMGSDENYNLIFPIPLFLSMFDQKERDSIMILEFTADLILPIKSQEITDSKRDNNLYDFKNLSRRGMESIPLSIFLGGKLGVKLNKVELTLSATPGLQIGENWNGSGVVLDAELTWHALKLGKTEFIVVAGAIFSDEKYSNLYYGVNSKDIIDGRKEYNAKSGYIGNSIAVHYHTWKPINSLIFGMFIEYQSMKDSVVEDSPLVVNKGNLSAGAGLGFFF